MKTESVRPASSAESRAGPRRLLKPGAWMAGIVVVGTALLSALDRPGAAGVARARPAPPAVKAVPTPQLIPAFALDALVATLIDDDRLIAIVDARQLAVHGTAGTSLAGHFTASLALADEGVPR